MITLDFSDIQLKLKIEKGKTIVFDPIRKIWIILTPEEHVRQYVLQYLIKKMNYPTGLIAVEKKILVGKMTRRFDIAVYDRNHQPWMLIECKEPEVPISDATFFQLLHYNRSIPSKYWLLTNGHQNFCADAGKMEQIKWLPELPAYNG